MAINLTLLHNLHFWRNFFCIIIKFLIFFKNITIRKTSNNTTIICYRNNTDKGVRNKVFDKKYILQNSTVILITFLQSSVTPNHTDIRPFGVPLTLLINTGKPQAFVANLSRGDRYYTAIYYFYRYFSFFKSSASYS